MHETTAARSAGRRAWPIDSADFWRLWFVGLVVFTVRWVETVAVGVFAYQHTASAFIVAVMVMLRLLPMGLFGAFLGAIAERIFELCRGRQRQQRDGQSQQEASHDVQHSAVTAGRHARACGATAM